MGSPPHVRGKARARSSGSPRPRITPACAGKSSSCTRHSSRSWDHPRMCGGKASNVDKIVWSRGSPPHVRGKEKGGVKVALISRITPACAGKSPFLQQDKTPNWDHPRVCGEKSSKVLGFSSVWGSPPRMRGKGNNCIKFTITVRITPAYAGKRLKRSRSTVSPVAIVPLFPSVCNKPVVSDGSPAGRDAPLFLPAENAVPASPAYNLRSL